jgi:hypothetical protein
MMHRLVLLLVAIAACSRTPAEPGTATTATTAAGSAAPAISTASPTPKPDLALLWSDPPTWQRVIPKSRARAAEYVIARYGPDPEDAECVVTTFGAHQGGTVDDNINRWVDQFQPVVPTPRRTSIDVQGMHATFLEATGTFVGNMMPNRPDPTPANKPGWRLLGAILEAPSGLWFFKLIGPDLTVRMAARPFEDMVRSARPK